MTSSIRPAITAELRGGTVYIGFAKDAALVAAMRSLPVKHYNWRTRLWDIPLGHVRTAYDALTAAGADASPLAQLVAIHAVRSIDGEAIIARYPGLFAHQQDGVRFLVMTRGAILADDMGLGKTRQAIIAAHERQPEGEILVVCPASLKLNWAREIRTVLPDAPVTIVNGTAGSLAPARWTMVNYDLLPRRLPQLLRPWACVILDEAHAIKNRDAARSKAVLRILAGAGDRYLLTGTPVMNRPIELLNLLEAVEHPLAQDYLAYGRRYCAGVRTPFGWDFSGASNLDELRRLTEGTVLRRRKEEVLDLPPKLRRVVPVAIPNRTRYDRLYRDVIAALETNAAANGGRPNWNAMLPALTLGYRG